MRKHNNTSAEIGFNANLSLAKIKTYNARTQHMLFFEESPNEKS